MQLHIGRKEERPGKNIQESYKIWLIKKILQSYLTISGISEEGLQGPGQNGTWPDLLLGNIWAIPVNRLDFTKKKEIIQIMWMEMVIYVWFLKLVPCVGRCHFHTLS